jgi:hypothetical protein
VYIDGPAFRMSGVADATVEFATAMKAAATRSRDGIIN